MHKYPYHSPVRFYKSKDDLSDDTNSQNLQFFGEKNPYPLEINKYHRFLLPSYENEIDSEELELYLVGDNETQVPCEFGIHDGRLLRVSFVFDKWEEGNFEIRKSTGETIFYSNCVKFINSDFGDGRKYVTIATKCYFDRLGYEFENSEYDWFITNLPAYDYGLYIVESEYNTDVTGVGKTPVIKDSFIHEISTIEFISKGDCNILNFILASLVNNEFYLNGTKRTIREKPDVDDYMISGKMRFSYDKGKTGMYIILNEEDIFSDAFKTILGNPEKTHVYGYNFNYVIPTK